MDIVLEILLEVIATPVMDLLKYFGGSKKSKIAIQIIVAILIVAAMLSLVIGAFFIASGDDFRIPGIIMTTISSVLIVAYLICGIALSFKSR